MPLKHHTETFLVFLLGAVMSLTGLLIATLPPLPEGIVPFGTLLLLAFLYPLILLPLFRKRRADYAFRLLHWVPTLMLLLWLGLGFSALSEGRVLPFFERYTWAWNLPGVATGFLLLALFCLRVVRRRVPRLALLLLAFMPFVAGGLLSEQGPHWEKELASFAWHGEWWKVEGMDVYVAVHPGGRRLRNISSPVNFVPSQDPAEEAWRERLRVVEKSGEALSDPVPKKRVERRDVREAVSRSQSSVIIADVRPELSGTGRELREAETLPERLPQSGGPLAVLGIFVLASYFGTLHIRARSLFSANL